MEKIQGLLSSCKQEDFFNLWHFWLTRFSKFPSSFSPDDSVSLTQNRDKSLKSTHSSSETSVTFEHLEHFTELWPAVTVSPPSLAQPRAVWDEGRLISWPPIALLPSPSISEKRAKNRVWGGRGARNGIQQERFFL